MTTIAFRALVRRDLRLFFTDRRAVVMSFVAPILFGSFFGFIFRNAGSDEAASKISVAVIDQDQSDLSRRLVSAFAADSALEVRQPALEEARASVRSGKTTVAVVIPKGFGDQAPRAFFRGAEKPDIHLLYDPSHAAELAMVRGVLAQHAMEAVSGEVFGANSGKYLDEARSEAAGARDMNPADRRALQEMLSGLEQWNDRVKVNPALGGNSGGGLSLPYNAHEEAVTARKGVVYNGMAHSFAGMAVQFILFMGMDAGLIVLAQRRTGLWKRLQAAPISRFLIIGSRAASATIIAVLILLVVFGFARVVFQVHVEGSLAGFVGVCVALGLMTAAFGLLVAVLGKTPEATRGLAILVTLILVMVSGAWVPAFFFPRWLQQASFAVPTRWAVDGLDAVIWRGLGFSAALGPIAAMLGFALLFGGIAVWRFRWETD